MVWSLNSISVRESIPVRTDFPGSIGSFTEARTGAFPGATVFTSLTMWVILAPVSGAAVAGSAAKNRADRMEDRVRIFIGKETGYEIKRLKRAQAGAGSKSRFTGYASHLREGLARSFVPCRRVPAPGQPERDCVHGRSAFSRGEGNGVAMIVESHGDPAGKWKCRDVAGGSHRLGKMDLGRRGMPATSGGQGIAVERALKNASQKRTGKN